MVRSPEAEATTAIDIGHDLGRAILNARIFEREHELVEELQALGIQVEGRIPSLVPFGEHARRYLEVKRQRMRHLLPERLAVPQAASHSTEGDQGASLRRSR